MEINNLKDQLNLEDSDMKRIPSFLNVLTILTYVGCAIQLLSSIYNWFTIPASYEKLESSRSMLNEATNSLQNETGGDGTARLAKEIAGSAIEIVKKQYENRHLILAVSLIAAALCFYGAMQMRNLKKLGLPIYIVGEWLPIILNAILIGFGSIFGAAGTVLGAIVALLFTILYLTQAKHLR